MQKFNYNLSGGVDVVLSDIGGGSGELKISTNERVYVVNLSILGCGSLLEYVKTCDSGLLLRDTLRFRVETVDVLASYENLCNYINAELDKIGFVPLGFRNHVNLVLAGFYDECKFYESRLNLNEVFTSALFLNMLFNSFLDINLSLLGSEFSNLDAVKGLFFRHINFWVDYIAMNLSRESLEFNRIINELKEVI